MRKKFIMLLLTLCLLSGLVTATAYADEPLLGSTKDIAQYIVSCANNLDEEITFSYTPALDYEFADEDALSDILNNCGLYRWYYAIYDSERRVEITKAEYRMGFRIARLIESGRQNLMTSDEQLILMEMEWLVEEARMYAPSPFDLLVRLHDAISCRAQYYTANGAAGTWDTVYGVMALSEADCDGYADAFYLAASLAGFNVGFQHGQADGGPHMWNLVNWDGQWYHVDVTWDDLDYYDDPPLTSYGGLMAGGHLLTDHSWDESRSPYAPSWGTNWDMYYYTADQTGMTYGAYYETLKDAANYIVYKHSQTGGNRLHVMVKGSYDDAVAFNECLKDAKLYGSWTTWTQQAGEYTCFTVLIHE